MDSPEVCYNSVTCAVLGEVDKGALASRLGRFPRLLVIYYS